MSKRKLAQAAKLQAEASGLVRTGRRAEAEMTYLRALSLAPDDVEALRNLAALRTELGKPELAVEAMTRLQRLRPNDPGANFNLGSALLQIGRAKDAVSALRRAVLLKPNFAEAQYSLGVALAQLGDHDGAIEAYANALRSEPEHTAALIKICDEHMVHGDWSAALDVAETTVRRFPEQANAHYVKGGLLALMGRLDRAEEATREALRLDPAHAGAFGNLGVIAAAKQDHAKAVSEFRRALELNPDMQEVRLGMTFSMLSLGDYEQGWAQHELSRSIGVLAYRKKEPVIWDGKPLPHGTLTLFGEAGLGDFLQFCRLVPLARERVRKVVLYLQSYYAPLARVLETLDGVDEVTLDPAALRTSDACLSVYSLPYIFGVSLERTPVPVPYLRADPALAPRWKQRLSSDLLPRVGLVWGGNANLGSVRIRILDARRSIPLPMLAPLLSLPDVSFYCLQKGAATEQLIDSPLAEKMFDYTAEITDFADTAALLDQLDLIISVDTSVVHLAGALGKPVWMLNRFDSCWRWGIRRQDAPWYPSLRIFQQPAFGEWAPVVDNVVEALRDWTRSMPARRGVLLP
jgi:tetratricopeptide (TPR) repeat protein